MLPIRIYIEGARAVLTAPKRQRILSLEPIYKICSFLFFVKVVILKMEEGVYVCIATHSDDKEICKAVSEELERFNKLIQGHKKLLEAIGNL